jgi:tRNA A37 threonylcarbamoyladenosine synthetase subunit TsaC/SUA5/YrdC
LIEACVAAAADGLVVVGTDTIYSLATRASPEGIARLAMARRAMQALRRRQCGRAPSPPHSPP